MRLLVLFALVVSVVYCGTVETDDHRPCCWKFPGTSKFRMVGGKVDPDTGLPVSVESRGIVYSKDDGRKRITFRNVSYSGAPEVPETEIANYFTMKWYLIKNGTCTEHDILFPMPRPCVPPNATYTGESTIGPRPGQQVTVRHYNLDWMDHRGYNIRIAVTARTCEMVIETDYGTIDGAKAVYTYFFSDRYPYDADDAMFVPPAHCHRA